MIRKTVEEEPEPVPEETVVEDVVVEEDEVEELAVGENEITYALINFINNTFVSHFYRHHETCVLIKKTTFPVYGRGAFIIADVGSLYQIL